MIDRRKIRRDIEVMRTGDIVTVATGLVHLPALADDDI